MMRFVWLSVALCTLLTSNVFAQCDRVLTTAPTLEFDSAVRAVTTARFDQDDRPDLAVAVDGNRVVILLNLGGTFARHFVATLPGTAYKLFTTDLHRDGDADIVAIGPGFISTMISFGNGTFEVANTTYENDTLKTTTPMVYADFNGDHNGDLAVAFESQRNITSSLRIFMGAPNGTFLEPNEPRILVRRARAIDAAELTNDGKQDLAIADSNAILLLPGNGNGSFAPHKSLMVTVSPSLVTADFDGDQRADILTSTRLLLSSRNFANGITPSIAATKVVDLDQDGKLDLLSGSLVYRGTGNGTFRNVSAGSGVNENTGYAVADFNGDGKLDVASGAISNTLMIRYGRGGGVLGGTGSTVDAGDDQHTVFAADINGDGRDDLITVAPGSVRTHLSATDGTLVPTASFAPNPAAQIAVLADFNHDNKLDLFLGRAGLALGNGDGTFAAAIAPPLNFVATGAAAGDFNDDGKLDVALASDRNVLRLYGDGSGHFFVETTPLPVDEFARGIASGDFNGDGRDDLVFTTLIGSATSLRLIDGNVPTASIKLADNVQLQTIKVADVDADNQLDVLVFSKSGNELLIFGGNGNNTFRTARSLPVIGGDPSYVAVGDFTRDGRNDIFITGSRGTTTVYAQEADGTLIGKTTLPVAGRTIATGDFNKDGYADLALGTANVAATYLNRCSEGEIRRRSVRH